jgi:hypothetical protein
MASFRGRVLRVLDWIQRRRERRSPRTERILLLTALVIFVAASIAAYRHLPPLERPVRLLPLLLAGFVGTPATVLLNGAEYRFSAGMLGHRVRLLEAVRIGLLGSAANVLPIPGAALIRIRALRLLGLPYGKATLTTGIVGLVWIGTTGVLAGILQFPAGRAGLGFALAGTGVLVLALSYTMIGAQAGARSGGVLMARIVAIEAAFIAVLTFRYYLVMMGIGFAPTVSQAVALTVSVVLASAMGFFPAGLGLRELLAAAIGPLVGLAGAVGVIATAVDRLLALVILSLAAVAMLALGALPKKLPEDVMEDEPVRGRAPAEGSSDAG